MTIRHQIRKELEQAAQADYQVFQAKLLPGAQGILGVRLPKLREIAKRIAKTDAEAYLQQMQQACLNQDAYDSEEVYYEEKMLFGLVIGYADLNREKQRRWLDVLIPVIDNWGVCDSCCMTYHWMKKQPEYWWDYLLEQVSVNTEFSVRFAFVSMLAHFIGQEYLQELFAVCDKVRHEAYYAKMAQAWLVSMCFVKFPEETYAYLQDDRMEDFTHNKAIQKTCESYRVDKEWKQKIRSLKRMRNRVE